MAYLDIPGARLWFDDTGGSGEPVVFVHPAAGSSASWQYQVPAFREGHRCVTYDLRGWARSIALDPNTAPGAISDDLVSVVDGLGLGRFHLVGAAYGGFGAVDFALRFPERLLSLVLSTTQGGVVEPEYAAFRERAVTAPIRQLPAELREVGPSYRAEDPEGVARWIAIEHAAGEQRPRQTLVTQITYAALSALRVPTLAIAAGADLLAPPALMRLLANQIPGCELRILPDAGHSAHWERPVAWNAIVNDFLQRHSA